MEEKQNFAKSRDEGIIMPSRKNKGLPPKAQEKVRYVRFEYIRDVRCFHGVE
jgi:hypothetical protein